MLQRLYCSKLKIEATLATAEVSAGAMAKADQNQNCESSLYVTQLAVHSTIVSHLTFKIN